MWASGQYLSFIFRSTSSPSLVTIYIDGPLLIMIISNKPHSIPTTAPYFQSMLAWPGLWHPPLEPRRPLPAATHQRRTLSLASWAWASRRVRCATTVSVTLIFAGNNA